MRRVYLSLTGGLGNQLFQLSAALAIARGDEIVIEWINCRPRLNQSLEAEIRDIVLPPNVRFQNRHRFQGLSSKAIGYLLRTGVNPTRIEKNEFIRSLTSFLASLINIQTFKRFIQINVNQGVGFYPQERKNYHKSRHLVGYFQTYKWLEHLDYNAVPSMFTVRDKSAQLEELIRIAAIEEPLVVHMRFGDYRLEDSFGLLKPKYYRESIRELWGSGRYKSIWVFSDEIGVAEEYLSGTDFVPIRFISDVGKSSAQTLQAMRLGKGYVIGNSSFSWWAAKLSNNQDALVVAPTPWFIGQEEPADLIPLNWIRRMGH